jgi:hypothetical protein
MYNVLNCHNVAKYTEFYLGQLRFNVTSTGNAECSKKSCTMIFQMLTVCRVLRKRLHLKAYKLSIVQHRRFVAMVTPDCLMSAVSET